MKHTPTRKQNTLDFIQIVSAFALIAFALRAWPILLLLLAVLIIAGLYWCWLWIFEKQTPIHNSLPALPKPQSPYHQLCQAVNKEILRIFPDAKWIWLTPCPMAAMWDNDFLAVRLYGASGYHRAVVHLVDGAFHRLQVTSKQTNASRDKRCTRYSDVNGLQPHGLSMGRIPNRFPQRKLQQRHRGKTRFPVSCPGVFAGRAKLAGHFKGVGRTRVCK